MPWRLPAKLGRNSCSRKRLQVAGLKHVASERLEILPKKSIPLASAFKSNECFNFCRFKFTSLLQLPYFFTVSK
jgi:hypothetical protein